MKRARNMTKIYFAPFATILLAGAAFAGIAAPADGWAATPAPLTVSNGPLPPELRTRLYNSPSRTPVIRGADLVGDKYFSDREQTIVGKKIGTLSDEIMALKGTVGNLTKSLTSLEDGGRMKSAEYYASVATISTQLQSGTTPGNPRLVQQLSIARNNLEQLSGNISALNDMAVNASSIASNANYLLEAVRATYSLAGAVEEDHVRLSEMEDELSATVVTIDRLLNNINDNITRTSAYMTTERDNLRTLSSAIASGDLLGKSLSNRPFSSARPASFAPQAAQQAAMQNTTHPAAPAPHATGGLMPAPANAHTPTPPPQQASAPSAPRPLVKIRFERQDVNFQQPVYMAVNEALSRYPDARFELVAVHPGRGNAAQVAIESTKARRNAENVLRSLTEMGLDLNRIDLSYMPSDNATGNEVHLYIR